MIARFFLSDTEGWISDSTSVRVSCFPQSTIAISFVSRRPVDHGFASPVLFVIGGWMYMEGRKEEVGDEEDGVQDIEDESE